MAGAFLVGRDDLPRGSRGDFEFWLSGVAPAEMTRQMNANDSNGQCTKQIPTLWLFNLAMENCPFIDGLPFLNMGIFHGYVK